MRWVASLAAAFVLAACSSPSPAPGATSVAGEIPAAVAASKAQRFTEINASVDGVTLFIADGALERSVVYRSGRLDAPSAPQNGSGNPFDAAKVRLSLGADLVKQVEAQFPGSRVTTVALLEVPPNGLVWALRSRSSKGGLLNLLFTPDGAPLSAVPT